MLVVQTFLSPSLGPSPETWAGIAQLPPVELASFTPLHCGIFVPCLLWSWQELNLMRGGPSVSPCSAGEGLKPWADAQSPPFPRGAGSISHPCPRQGLLGWLHPSSLGGHSLPSPLSFPRQRSLQSALSDGSCCSKSTSPALFGSEIAGSHHSTG